MKTKESLLSQHSLTEAPHPQPSPKEREASPLGGDGREVL